MIDELDYGYATQFLSNSGNKILVNGKPILEYKGGKIFDIKPLKTVIPVNESLLEPDQNLKIINNEEDLAKLGFCVTSEEVGDIIYYKHQRKKYVLSRNMANKMKMPEGHYVEYSLKNQAIRLVGKSAGPFGYGPWVKVKIKREVSTDNFDFNEILNEFLPLQIYNKKKQKFIEVPEIPVMISDEGELVCIPKEKDEPTIAFVGVKRTGKTWTMHGVVDRAYHKYNVKIAIMNDFLNECKNWALPWIDPNHSWLWETSIEKQLKKIGEHSLPLPCVFLTPVTNVKTEYTGKNSNVGFQISFPFKELIRDYRFYLKEKKEWKLVNAGRYFRAMENELLKCKNIDDIEEVVYSKLPGKGDMSMRSKILSVMEDIYNENFLDLSSGVPAYWDVELKDGHKGRYSPIISCLLCDLIPVLQTREIKAKDYFPQYFRYLVNDIFDKQINDPYFVNNHIKIWLVVDELTLISSTDEPGPASSILQQCVTVGGPSRIGFLYATQNYSKIPQRIRSNTKYLFAFRFNNSKEASLIASDFNLSDAQKDKILSLKKFEMLAMTSERFICYDSEGNSYESEGPIRGFALPPLSMHKAPSKEEQ